MFSAPQISRLVRAQYGRYSKAIAYAAYGLVLLVAAAGLWAFGLREYEARLDHLQHELADVTDSVSQLVATSVNHVDSLRRQAEATLADTTAPSSAKRLFDALAPSRAFAGYALDNLPDGERPDLVANLTGSGALPPAESGEGREIQMALSLNPLFRATHEQVPDAAWIYYTSKNHFLSIFPWVDARDFHWTEDLPTYDFYKMGLPSADPARQAFWTDVYVDAGGKGLMATVGQPVYDGNEQFRGTMNLDLTLGVMSRYLAMGEFSGARVLLINDKDRVIADSAAAGAEPSRVINLAELLADPQALHLAATAHARPNAYHAHQEWIIESVPVFNAPWRIMMIVDRGALFAHVAQTLWVGFVGFLVLIAALVAFEQRRRAAGTLTENVAALQTMTVTLANARDEALQANRTKSMLLANVSHELRTPLNAINGFSDLMKHQIYGPLGNERYVEYAADIHRSGEMLLSLINDLLDVTKLESGRHELEESTCDLAGLVEEASGLVKMQAEKGGVALELQIDSAIPQVNADERALRQIALNLLSNAVKFTPAGGSVMVSCALDAKGRPTIVVKDTGCGIPQEEMKDLFQPFARATEAKRASTPGTGLGLAIVKSLVELHQGTIAMGSRVGHGTTVTVTLPAARIIRAEAAQEAA
jgi:signal transduction histidine kinase